MLDALALSRVAERYRQASFNGAQGPSDEGVAEGRILFVDDEPSILDALARSLHRDYEVHTAEGGEAGLKCVAEKGPFAVVISDMRMPGMDGAAFLAAVRRVAPDTVRMLLTGHADMTSAMKAVNEGQLFRFLAKPCPKDDLLKALEGAHEQYRLVRAEREVLARTLRASVTVLVRVLNLTDPNTFGHASVLARFVAHMAMKREVGDAWQYDLAAMLSQIGCIAILPETMARIRAGQEVSEEDRLMFASHPEIGRQIVENIPRLQSVARMISLQTEGGSGADDDPEVELGGAMLRLGLAIHRLASGGLSVDLAVARLRQEGAHDERLLDAMGDYRDDWGIDTIRVIPVTDLEVGMVLDEDLKLRDGTVSLGSATEIDAPLLDRARRLSASHLVQEPFRVRVPSWTLGE